MSLTSFLKNKDVKERFSQEFPKPEFNLASDIIAQPKTKHYALVGTAFDYLMRFYLKKINPHAITQEWVAESVIHLVSNKKLLKKIKGILSKARYIYTEYLRTGDMNNEVMETCLLLAQLDPIYRGSYISRRIGFIHPGDMEDLRNLLDLINMNEFCSKKICLLNPTFGEASILVGGADMDLLLDNVLIDIKTTKYLKLKRDYINQLIGYYLLYLIGGIDGAPSNANIKFIGIYYSRHGLLYKSAIKDIMANCDLEVFIKWFKKRANQEFQI